MSEQDLGASDNYTQHRTPQRLIAEIFGQGSEQAFATINPSQLVAFAQDVNIAFDPLQQLQELPIGNDEASVSTRRVYYASEYYIKGKPIQQITEEAGATYKDFYGQEIQGGVAGLREALVNGFDSTVDAPVVEEVLSNLRNAINKYAQGSPLDIEITRNSSGRQANQQKREELKHAAVIAATYADTAFARPGKTNQILNALIFADISFDDLIRRQAAGEDLSKIRIPHRIGSTLAAEIPKLLAEGRTRRSNTSDPQS